MPPRRSDPPADEQPASPTVNGDPPRAGRNIRQISSAELFQDAVEVIIVHAGREYRLRVTTNGKLILTA